MKKIITIRIPEPCHENWAIMTLTEKGRHCLACEKEVVDFTSQTREQLYKSVQGGDNMCGRFRRDQLNTPISLNRYKGRSFAQYAASLLVPAAILSARESRAQTDVNHLTIGEVSVVEIPANKYESLGITALSRKQKKAIPNPLIITGTVTESNGPLPGAYLKIKGTDRITQTDFDGKYTLEVYPGETIHYSYVGFESREILVSSQISISIRLESDTTLSNVYITAGIVSVQSYRQYKKHLRKEKRQKKKNDKQ